MENNEYLSYLTRLLRQRESYLLLEGEKFDIKNFLSQTILLITHVLHDFLHRNHLGGNSWDQVLMFWPSWQQTSWRCFVIVVGKCCCYRHGDYSSATTAH